jgi:phosphoglycerate dehydrogenase-like enzyme
MPQPLTIWSNTKFPPQTMERLVRGLAGHKLTEASATTPNNLAGAPPDPLLEKADVALGQPDPGQVMKIPHLRWVQLTTAGYTRYDTPQFREAVNRAGTKVCNASSVYAEPCAQHVVAMMLTFNRRLPQSLENQRGPQAWPYLPLRAESKLLNGQTVLLVGYGSIARRVAELLAPYDMNLVGFRRRRTGDEGRVKILSITDLEPWLSDADHVINMLPASDETEEFFNADRFVKLKRSAFYYNIGRGSTNDEKALEVSLQTGHFAAAYLDAFQAEPLPKHHALWKTPNCFVTPHTAGGHATEYERHVDLILENLKRFESGEDLIDRIM